VGVSPLGIGLSASLKPRLGRVFTLPGFHPFRNPISDVKPLFRGSPHVWFQGGSGHALPAVSRTLTLNGVRQETGKE
jgi:hypothetical protein